MGRKRKRKKKMKTKGTKMKTSAFRPNLIIPNEVFQKIMWWINKSEHEVSGFGSLEYDQTAKTFTVKDVILLEQEVSSASTELDPVAIGKAMYEMREQPNALKWHWHSHVNMGVFWSADDLTLIRDLGKQGWILATVFNKRKEMKTAFCGQMKIEGLGDAEMIFLDDLTASVINFIPKDLYEAWDQEYSSKVKVERPIYQYPNQHSLPSGRNLHPPGFVPKRTGGKTDLPGDGEGYSYDRYGWRYSRLARKWVYNPIYDTELEHFDQIVEGILGMDDDDVESAWYYWEDKDNEFRAYYEIAKAKHFTELKKDAGVIERQEGQDEFPDIGAYV